MRHITRSSRHWMVPPIVAVATALAACGHPGTGAQALTPAAAPPPPSTTAPSTAAPATADPTGATCATADLRAGLVVRPDDLGAHRAAVVWTNTSGHRCTMYGFGGVDLAGPDQRPYGPVDHLPRSDEQPTTVSLPPGGSAQTVLNYLSSEGAAPADTWTPDHALVTPPDETHSVSLPWSFGSVTRQDGATHPGTFLHPVTPVPDTDPAACTAQDVSADLAGGDAGASNRSTSLQLRARDGHRCTLAGPLPVVLQDAGKVIIYREPGTAASSVIVDGAHPASVRLHWTVANQPQVTPGAVTVRLPGTSDAVTVPWNAGPVDASDNAFSIDAGPVTSAP